MSNGHMSFKERRLSIRLRTISNRAFILRRLKTQRLWRTLETSEITSLVRGWWEQRKRWLGGCADLILFWARNGRRTERGFQWEFGRLGEWRRRCYRILSMRLLTCGVEDCRKKSSICLRWVRRVVIEVQVFKLTLHVGERGKQFEIAPPSSIVIL